VEYYQKIETPIGALFLVANEDALTQLTINPLVLFNNVKEVETPLLKEGTRQIKEYFSKKRTCFSLPLAPKGTDFQINVWKMLLEIPFGETRTYQYIATAIQKPTASRAVGGAIGKNPLLLLIPCHRVIGADGSLTGFSAGMQQKKYLLALENIVSEDS